MAPLKLACLLLLCLVGCARPEMVAPRSTGQARNADRVPLVHPFLERDLEKEDPISNAYHGVEGDWVSIAGLPSETSVTIHFNSSIFRETFREKGKATKAVKGAFWIEKSPDQKMPYLMVYMRYEDPTQLGGAEEDRSARWHKTYFFDPQVPLVTDLETAYSRKGDEARVRRVLADR